MIRFYLDRSIDPCLTFERKSDHASGYDLSANIRFTDVLRPRARATYDTGVYLAMPPGMEAQVRPRSGMVRDHGLVTQFGTIDADYRGQISLIVINLGEDEVKVEPGTRLAQLVFAPVVIPEAPIPTNVAFGRPHWPVMVEVGSIDALGTTARGSRGFGSTGYGTDALPPTEAR